MPATPAKLVVVTVYVVRADVPVSRHARSFCRSVEQAYGAYGALTVTALTVTAYGDSAFNLGHALIPVPVEEHI